jgi:hypothetical protein
MTSVELIVKIDDAIQQTKQLIAREPDRSALPIILRQLLDLQSIYARDRNFAAVQKDKVTMGVIVAKSDYDVIFPQYADLIHDITFALDNAKT